MPPPACCFAPLRRCSLPGGTHCNNPCETTPMLPGAGAPCPPRGLLRGGLSPPGTGLQGRGHRLATSKPGGESSAGCHPPFPGYSPHGIPVLQAGLPGPSPCSTVERCLSTAEHRPYPSPGIGSGITPAPRSRASPHPCSPHPRPPAGRCCHPHGAGPFTRRRGAGWGGGRDRVSLLVCGILKAQCFSPVG